MSFNGPREDFLEEATEATLLFIHQEDEVLLIEKKRGVGKGFYNGPGGKVEEEEPEHCAVRETREETNVRPKDVEKIGELEFIFGEDPFMFVHVFKSKEFEGEPEETEEARPEWFKTDEIPFEEMWPDDKYWVPKMLDNEQFEARFYFDEEGNNVLDYNFK